MVYKNHHWMGGRRCTKTAVQWVGDGVQKPPLGLWATVRENRREMGKRWCTKTAMGWCAMVRENHREMGV